MNRIMEKDQEKFSVDYPNKMLIQQQVQAIVSAGIKKPKSYPQYLKEMYQNLGLGYIFRDATELIFIILIAFGVLFTSINTLDNDVIAKDLYSLIFILSPVLYFVIGTFFLVRKNNTFEVEMTCKYHVFQLAAFRMLAFSIIAMLANILLVVVVFLSFQFINIIEALMISISSLSVFSALYLYAIQKLRIRFTSLIIMTSWLLINLLPVVLSQDIYSLLLSKVPALVYLIVVTASLTFYMNSLKKLIAFRNVEGVLKDVNR